MPRDLPYLLLDKEKCLANISRMADKVQRHSVKFRPHFKTHQSIAVGEWFKHAGVEAITVSSVRMAEYFASAGWKDITIAFPLSLHDAERVGKLAASIQVNIITSSHLHLSAIIGRVKVPMGIFIELDTGHHRSGVNPESTREIALMVNIITQNPSLAFKGFITHAGHTYQAATPLKVETIHREILSTLTRLKAFWRDSYPSHTVSYGDTPSCSICDEFWGIDELRPGNFVFFDATQAAIGTCKTGDIAVGLICPVIDVYPGRGEALVHAGAIHLSKDSLANAQGDKSFGLICPFNGEVWGDPYTNFNLKSISQEHGVIASSNPEDISLLKHGDLLAILPVHSCLTVDTMGELFLNNGERISTLRSHAW